MPRMYGYKNVKWVTRIEVQTTSTTSASGSSAATTRTRGSGVERVTH